jgi:hypothetical protein
MYVMHPHAESLSQPCLLVFLCTAGWAGLCTHSHVTGMTRSTGRIVADAHRAHTVTIWKRADFAHRQGATGCVVRVRRGHRRGFECEGRYETPLDRLVLFVTFVCVVCMVCLFCARGLAQRGGVRVAALTSRVIHRDRWQRGICRRTNTHVQGGWVGVSPSSRSLLSKRVCAWSPLKLFKNRTF